MREITLTFTDEEWRDMLEADGNDCANFPDGVRDKIISALCPNGHTEDVERILIHSSWSSWHPYQFTGGCKVCLTPLWVVRASDWVKKSYEYIDWTDDDGFLNRIKFFPGDQNDPKKELDWT